jgi:hypothetical protein
MPPLMDARNSSSPHIGAEQTHLPFSSASWLGSTTIYRRIGMKRIRTLGVSLLILFAFSAIMAVAAYAEEGFLPLKAKGFTIEGKTTTLNTASNSLIVCGKLDPSKGTFLSDKHATVILQFLECTQSGFAVNSVGDSPKTILAPVELLVCLVNSEKLVFGIDAEIEGTLNLELSGLGVKIAVRGRVIGEATARAGVIAKVFTVNYTGAKGIQNVTKCTDSSGAKEHTLQLEPSLTKKAEMASLNVEKGTMTFEEEVELMDS